MIHRRTFVAGMAAVVVTPVIADAQASAKVYRIGLLMPGPTPHLTDPLTAALRERGWIIGRNISIEMRHTLGEPNRADVLANEFVQDGIDLNRPRCAGGFMGRVGPAVESPRPAARYLPAFATTH